MIQIINEIKRKVLMMIGMAVIEAVKDSTEIQKNQVSILSGEVHSDYDRFQEYGFSSVPVVGAQAIIACIGGSRDHGAVIATDDARYRPKGLKAGEVIIYNNKGDYVKFLEDQTIEIKAATKVKIIGELEVTGDIRDNIGSNNDTIADMRATYNSHTHPGDSGGTTGAPDQSMG